MSSGEGVPKCREIAACVRWCGQEGCEKTTITTAELITAERALSPLLHSLMVRHEDGARACVCAL